MTIQVRVLLEGYFMTGNINKSNRYTANDMHKELVKCAQDGEINNEEGSTKSWYNSKLDKQNEPECTARRQQQKF